MLLLLLFGTRTRITTQPDRTTTMNTKFGGNVKEWNADTASWKKGGWVPTSVTGVVVSPTAGEVAPKANDHIKQVSNAVKCTGYII